MRDHLEPDYLKEDLYGDNGFTNDKEEPFKYYDSYKDNINNFDDKPFSDEYTSNGKIKIK